MRMIAIKSLRTRLILLIALAVIPALIFIFYTSSEQLKKRDSEIERDAIITARLAAHSLEQLFSGSRQMLTSLAELPAVREYDNAACTAYVSSLKKNLPMYANIAAVKPNGDIFCSAVATAKAVNVADRLYFKSAVNKRGFAVGEYVITRVYNKPAITAALPVLDNKKQLRAIVFASIGLDWLKDELGKINLQREYEPTLTVVDHNSTILYRSGDSSKWIGKSASNTELTNKIGALKEGVVTASSALDGIERIYAYTSVPGLDDTILIRYGISRAAVFSNINGMLISNLIALLAITLLALIVAWYGSDYFVMRRLKLLQKATAELEKGNLKARVDVTGNDDEISRLGADFNRMAEALEIQNQKRSISEENYRKFFEETNEIISVATPDGRYLDMNPAGIEIFGYGSKEEILAVDIARDLYSDPEERAAYKKIIEEQGFVKDYELRLKRKDGRVLNILASAVAIRDEQGNITEYHAINRDITERKLAEKEKENLEAQLRQAHKMEAVGQLAGGVAHDFNNILAVIVSIGYLLQMQLKENDTAMSYVSEILHAADRAAGLTQSLLAFSRKQHSNPKPINLNTTIQKTEKILARTIGEDIHLVLRLTEQNTTVNADDNQIAQILINLAANARDAMPKGGELTISTERIFLDEDFMKMHSYGRSGDYILMTFTDSGAGMDAATLQRAFEPFFTTKEVGKGTGLGLSMVYGIVKQHEGYIDANSKAGKGTAFKIYLPALEIQVEEKEDDGHFKPDGATETILLVEDDRNLRRALTQMLQRFGHTVIEAYDGDDAVTKFRRHKDDIHLVLMDVIMPRKSGGDAYLELRAIKPDLEIILMSGYAGDFLSDKLRVEEEVHFIPKPVSPKELFEKIRTVLRGGTGL